MKSFLSIAIILCTCIGIAYSADVAPVKQFEFRITAGNYAPDCFERQVLLVNGKFAPQTLLEVDQGDMMELTLINDVPSDFPLVPGGLSIHWHGFSMVNASWYDGASFINICPVQPGNRFTYRFVVNEMPGTYFWHAHTGAAIVDGLTGPLIVRPKKDSTPYTPFPTPKYDAEHIMFITDFYHSISGLLVAPLNRPFSGYAPSNWTPDDGNFTWVGNPPSVLINGKGVASDCSPPPAGSPAGTNGVCNVTSVDANGCGHAVFNVEAGKTYLFRIINSASLLYQTVCFEGHSVTIVAADAVAIDPVVPPTNCIDVNAGQRYDVLVTANGTPGQSYWIASQAQFRAGAPSGFAILKYGDAASATKLPSTPTPQPGSVAPWSTQFYFSLKINPVFLGPDAYKLDRTVYDVAATPVPAATARMMLNLSQPVLSETGQIRWALNNIVGAENPPCNNLQNLLTTDPAWQQAISNSNGAMGTGWVEAELNQQNGPGSPTAVFVANLTNPMALPINPAVGSHVAPVKLGSVIEVVIQNNPANSFNGGGGNRTAQEQHPFHMHGHHFWVLGGGNGAYPGPDAAAAGLNTINPPLRDTVTLYANTWIVFRFLANNPGTWLMHCHIPFHQQMGQAMAISEAAELITSPPAGMPICPSPCSYSEAPWKVGYTNEKFKNYIPSPPPPPSPPSPPPPPSPPSPPPAPVVCTFSGNYRIRPLKCVDKYIATGQKCDNRDVYLKTTNQASGPRIRWTITTNSTGPIGSPVPLASARDCPIKHMTSPDGKRAGLAQSTQYTFQIVSAGQDCNVVNIIAQSRLSGSAFAMASEDCSFIKWGKTNNQATQFRLYPN